MEVKFGYLVETVEFDVNSSTLFNSSLNVLTAALNLTLSPIEQTNLIWRKIICSRKNIWIVAGQYNFANILNQSIVTLFDVCVT